MISSILLTSFSSLNAVCRHFVVQRREVSVSLSKCFYSACWLEILLTNDPLTLSFTFHFLFVCYACSVPVLFVCTVCFALAIQLPLVRPRSFGPFCCSHRFLPSCTGGQPAAASPWGRLGVPASGGAALRAAGTFGPHGDASRPPETDFVLKNFRRSHIVLVLGVRIVLLLPFSLLHKSEK